MAGVATEPRVSAGVQLTLGWVGLVLFMLVQGMHMPWSGYWWWDRKAPVSSRQPGQQVGAVAGHRRWIETCHSPMGGSLRHSVGTTTL